MGDRSSIEWTDATWNPLRGCSRVSEGCRHCYAERVAARFSGEPLMPYYGLATRKGWTGKVVLIEEHLADPLRWQKPRRVFVNSMSDLFHERVPDEWIDRTFAVMAIGARDVERCRRRDCSHDPCGGDGSGRFAHHVYQVLTKRPERMRAYVSHPQRIDKIAEALSEVPGFVFGDAVAEDLCDEWPLPNVWLGVSIEDQATADARIPLLLQTPAAVRFVSYEPALGPVVFRPSWMAGYDYDGRGCSKRSAPRLDQVIVGGESGPGARPFDVAWARSTIAQCKAAEVACFVKQLGAQPQIGTADQSDWGPYVRFAEDDSGEQIALRTSDRKGGDPSEWPEDLRVREFPR